MYGLPSTSHFSPESRIINTPLFPLDNRHAKSCTSWHDTLIASKLEPTPTPPSSPVMVMREHDYSVTSSCVSGLSSQRLSLNLGVVHYRHKKRVAVRLMRNYLQDNYSGCNLKRFIATKVNSLHPQFDKVIAMQLKNYVRGELEDTALSDSTLKNALKEIMKEIMES